MKHSAPALMSFVFPGIGQLAKKHFLKMALIVCVACLYWWLYFSLFNQLYIAGRHFSFLAALALFAPFWAWNVFDAYNTN